MSYPDRGSQYDEAIEVLRAAWRGGPIDHHGRHFRFEGVQVAPEPVAIPLVLGGNTEGAMRRAARVADAWIASSTPPFDDAVHLVQRVRALAEQADRRAPLRTIVRVPSLAARCLDPYREAGFDEVLVWAHAIFDAAPTSNQRDAVQRAVDVIGQSRSYT